MSLSPPFAPLFERVVDFAVKPQNADDIALARADHFARCGEVFEDDRSFDVRMQAFLDWLVFDRPLKPFDDPPARLFVATLTDKDERQRFRLLSRTVHGLFEVVENGAESLAVQNLLTAAEYEVPVEGPLAGLHEGDLFEGRLVPFDGRLHFSNAFLFHPPEARRRVLREVDRQRREEAEAGVQNVLWTLARMASRLEHYRNVPLEVVYDFQNPPPVVRTPPMRFDRASLDERRRRLVRSMPRDLAD